MTEVDFRHAFNISNSGYAGITDGQIRTEPTHALISRTLRSRNNKRSAPSDPI